MAYVGLSYPFRIDSNNRRFAAVSSDTDTYKAEQIQSYLRTYKGDRLLFPSFGIDDPVFSGFDVDNFIDDFLEFYSSDTIPITSVTTATTEGVVSDVIIEFK